MFYSKKTWFILSILAFFCAFGAYKIFPQTFPILNINLDMSREEAIAYGETFGIPGFAPG